MKKTAVALMLILALAVLIIGAAYRPAESAPGMQDEKVREMARDVQTLNLLNSLHLDRSQMQKMMAVAGEVKSMDDKLKALQDKKQNRIYSILKEMKSQLMSSNDITDDLKRQYHQEFEVIKKAQIDQEEKLKQLGERAYDILNENQRVMLKEYQPCLVPVKNIANPERIGQAGGGERFYRMMEHVRRVPEDRYPQVKEKILAKAKEKLRLHVRDKNEREEALQKVSRALDEVRTLSDSEFEIKKAEIAEGLVPQKQNKDKNVEKRYVQRFLLNPGLAGILRQKLNTAKR